MDQQIETALSVLRRGGLVAYPTDTVYGLGADATNPQALRRIFVAKRRYLAQPLPLLAADVDMMRRVAPTLNSKHLGLLSPFIPGALTIVATAASWVPHEVTAGSNTVAVRVPGHDLCRELCAELGRPIVGTSANLSGQPSPLTAAEAKQQLGDGVDYVIQGKCIGGVESTIVDLTTGNPQILREGAIPAHAVLRALGETAAKN